MRCSLPFALLLVALAALPTPARAGEPASPTTLSPAEQVAASRARLPPAEGSTLVHWSEVEVKVRATVRDTDYPPAALEKHLPPERCIVRMRLDERGVPYEVLPGSCADIFVASARDIGMRYRFYPLKVSGERVKFEFDLVMTFKAP